MPRVAAFVLMVAGTRLLAPQEYGLLALTIVVGEVAEVIASNWMRVAFLRLAAGNKELSSGSLRRFLMLFCGTMTISVVISVTIAWLISPARFAEFAVATSCYAASTGLMGFTLTLYTLRGRKDAYLRAEVIRSIVITAFPVLSMMYAPSFLMASLAGSAGTALVAIATLPSAAGRLPNAPAAFRYGEIFSFAVPLTTIAILSYGITTADRFLLEHFHDTIMVGYYAAAYALSRQGIDALASAVNIPGFPQLVSRYSEWDEAASGQAVADQAGLLIGLIFPAASVFIILRGEIFGLILPPAYQPTAMIVSPLVVFGAVSLALKNYVFDNVFHITRKNWLHLPGLLVGASISVSIAYLLIPRAPQLGPAAAFSAGSFSALVTSAIISRKIIRIPVPRRALLNALLTSFLSAGAARMAADLATEHTTIIVLTAGASAAGISFILCMAATHAQAVRGLLKGQE
jgi:O-antigen/teichoic acid export membrane protein